MTKEKSLTASAAGGGMVTMVAQALRIIALFLQVVVMSRLVPPEVYGLLAMALAFTGVAVILRDFGLSASALRAPSLSPEQQSNLFWLNTLMGVILTAALFLLAYPIARFYAEPQLVAMVQWIAPAYLLSGMTAQFRVALGRSLRFRALAVSDVLPPFFALAASAPIAASGRHIESLIVLQLAGPLTGLILSAWQARWIPSLPSRTEGMKPLLTFGLGFAATQMLSYATRNVDSIAIGRVWGATPLGYYDRAYQVAAAPINQINGPMTKVALPVLSRVVHDPARFARGLERAQVVSCYVTATLLFVMAGVSEPLTELTLGPEWLPAAPMLAVLAVGSVFRSIQQIATWIMSAKGAARALLRANLVGQPMIIACVLAGLPAGPLGVALGGVIGNAIFWVFSLWWAGRQTGVATRPLFARALLAIACVGLPAGAAALVVSSAVHSAPVVEVLAGSAAGLVTVLVSAVLIPPVKRDILVTLHLLKLR